MNCTVHLIDDDEPARESLGFLLATMDYQVCQYPSAERFLLDHVDEPVRSVVVSDIKMPGLNGIEFTRGLRRRGWTVPIVLVSGHADSLLAEEAIDAGASGFIQKPYAEAQVQMMIETLSRTVSC